MDFRDHESKLGPSPADRRHDRWQPSRHVSVLYRRIEQRLPCMHLAERSEVYNYQLRPSCERNHGRCGNVSNSAHSAPAGCRAGYRHRWDDQSCLRFTLPMGYCASSNVWPATTFATDGGTIPFGTRFRLKSSFDTSKFSPIAQILLTQLKQYGLILADGGTGWAVDVEYTKWPATIANALYEISFAKIAPSNFEVVDESGYMISSTSGETTSNREIVTFTRTSDNATASVDVVLTGVTVNFPHDLLQIQVGAPPLQLTALVNGASNTSVTWSMSPSVGTLSASGLYTPPTNISSPTTITVTATSVANPAVAASMTLNVFPAGPIRLVPGSVPGVYNYTMKPTPYADSSGNVWSSLGDDGGYANDGGTISGTSDSALYRY